MDTTTILFGAEFWSTLFLMAVFGVGAGFIVPSFPEMNHLTLRKIFGFAAIITMGYNFYAYDTGAWDSVIETAIQFFVMTYLFACVAERRLVPLGETWSGPPSNLAAKKKRR